MWSWLIFRVSVPPKSGSTTASLVTNGPVWTCSMYQVVDVSRKNKTAFRLETETYPQIPDQRERKKTLHSSPLCRGIF